MDFCNLRVGIDIPTIEVRFEHLNVEAEAYVGSRALPTMLNFTYNILEVALIQMLYLKYMFLFVLRHWVRLTADGLLFSFSLPRDF